MRRRGKYRECESESRKEIFVMTKPNVNEALLLVDKENFVNGSLDNNKNNKLFTIIVLTTWRKRRTKKKTKTPSSF